MTILLILTLLFGSICPPSVVVSDAGSTAVYGTFTPRGTEAGKMFYKISTDPSDEPFGQGVFWDGGIAGGWSITDSDSTVMYYSMENVKYPYQVKEWHEYNGVAPMPTVIVTP